MTAIIITLDDAQIARLQEFARERHQTLDEAIQVLLAQALPNAQGESDRQSSPSAQPSSRFPSTLALAGIISDPAITPLTARQIDEILAQEALNQRAMPDQSDLTGEHAPE